MQEFQLTIEDKTFNFELENGIVYLIEDNNRLGKEGTSIGNTEYVRTIENAKEIARQMLYSRRLIKNI